MESNDFYTAPEKIESNSEKNTFKLIKESWKNYSKQQRLQFVGLIALVLAVPALVGSVATARYIASRAYPATPPVTPPISPSPTVTATPTSTPVACIQRVQTVSLSPSTQSGLPGTQLVYYLSVTNNDNQGCSKSEFNLSSLVSSGWSGLVSNTILSLDPGATGTAGVAFTSSFNALPNSYPVSVVVNGPIAQNVATAAYKVLATPPTPTPTIRPTPTAIPTPTATPTPNIPPVISTNLLPIGYAGKPYKAIIKVYDLNINDRVAIDAVILPPWINDVECAISTANNRKTYTCTYSGTPRRAGVYTMKVVANDGMGENVVKKLFIFILPNFSSPFPGL